MSVWSASRALLVATLLVAAMPARAETEEAPRSFAAPSIELSSLQTRWRLLRDAAPGTEEEVRAFEALRTSMAELGLLELPAHALVLLQEADEALQAGDSARADRLRDWSRSLAPGSAQPHFLEARRAWDETPWRVGAIVEHLRQAYRRLSDDLAGRAAIGMQWRTVVAYAGIGVSLLFALLVGWRAGGPLALDLRLLLLKGPTLGQTRVLTGLLFAAPALILWSPYAFVISVVIFAGPYMRVDTRVGAVFVLAFTAALPSLTEDYARLVSANEDNAARVIWAVVAPCEARCVDQLELRIERSDDDNAALARAWTFFKTGTPDNLRRAAELLGDRPFAEAARSSADTLRGHLAFSSGDLPAAEEAYRAAEQSAVSRAQQGAALFNLYRLYTASERRGEAEAALASALRAAPTLVDRRIGYEGRSQNRVLAVSPLPARLLADELLEAAESGRAADAAEELLAPWYGAVPVALTPVITAALVAWLLLTLLFSLRKVTSRRCEHCAAPTSRLVLASAYDAGACILCYQLIAIPGQLTYEQRKAREDRAHRSESLRNAGSLIANLLVPGAGHVAAGRAWLGLPLLCLFAFGASVIVVDSTPLAVPYSLGIDRLFDGRVQVGGFTMGLAWLASVISVVILRMRRS